MIALALIIATLGPIAVLILLAASAAFALRARHIALAGALLAVTGLWAWATFDVVDLFDGPMRLSPEVELLGTGRDVPRTLNPSGSPLPAWWIIALAALAFAVPTIRAPSRPLRITGIAGLTAIGLSIAAILLIDATYA